MDEVVVIISCAAAAGGAAGVFMSFLTIFMCEKLGARFNKRQTVEPLGHISIKR